MSYQINTDTTPVIEAVCPQSHYPQALVDVTAKALYRHGRTVKATIEEILKCSEADEESGGGVAALDKLLCSLLPPGEADRINESVERLKKAGANAQQDKPKPRKLNRQQRRARMRRK